MCARWPATISTNFVRVTRIRRHMRLLIVYEIGVSYGNIVVCLECVEVMALAERKKRERLPR